MSISFPLKPRPTGARKKSASQREQERRAKQTGEAPSVSHGYVQGHDGTKLFYSVEGKGKPLVFCYGLVCSSLHWTYQIDYFQKTHQAIWFDYRGHQNSDVPKNLDSLNLENIARDLGTVLDELGIPDAVLLGHSMGVNVVLEFYRQQPHRVAGMVLANGTPKPPLQTAVNGNALQAGFNLARLAHKISPALVSYFWKKQKGNPLTKALITLGGFNPHLTPSEDIELYINQIAEMDPAIFLKLLESYENYDATSWLHTIKAPTLLIAGDQDRVVPLEQQEFLHQLIPGSQLEVVKHGSHCPQMDLPELVNLKIEKFLAEISFGSGPIQTKEIASRSTAKHRSPRRAATS